MAEVARKSLARETSYSFVAIAVTLIFVSPIYWAASISLRQPIESLKAPGIGIPFLSFEPTIEHWVVQLANRETQQALVTIGTTPSLRLLGKRFWRQISD